MKYSIEIKWAILFFVATMAWILFEKAMGWHGERIDQHARFSLIYDFLFITVYAMAFYDKRQRVAPSPFAWRDGFKFGLGLTCIVTALSPLVQTITHEIISPDFFANVIGLAVAHDILTQEAAEARFKLRNYVIENGIGTFVLGVLCSLVLALIFRQKTFVDHGESASTKAI